MYISMLINTLRPRENGRHFPDDIFKCIFLIENVWISIKISPKFVPWGPNNNFPSLVQIMAWRRPGDKPLYEPMMVSLLRHICVTRPHWVNIETDVLSSLQFCFKFNSCVSFCLHTSLPLGSHAAGNWGVRYPRLLHSLSLHNWLSVGYGEHCFKLAGISLFLIGWWEYRMRDQCILAHVFCRNLHCFSKAIDSHLAQPF